MKRARQRGFTLLELLITLAVTTIGLVGLLALHVSITRGNDGASRSAEAMAIGGQTLETLRSQRSTDMMKSLTGNPASLPPVTGAITTVTGRNGMTYRVQTFVKSVAGSASLWLLRVEVGWTEDGAAQGASGGTLDHLLPIEVMRTKEDAL